MATSRQQPIRWRLRRVSGSVPGVPPRSVSPIRGGILKALPLMGERRAVERPPLAPINSPHPRLPTPHQTPDPLPPPLHRRQQIAATLFLLLCASLYSFSSSLLLLSPPTPSFHGEKRTGRRGVVGGGVWPLLPAATLDEVTVWFPMRRCEQIPRSAIRGNRPHIFRLP